LSNPIQAVPVRHPGRWLAAAVILVLAAMLAHTLVTNENFHWDVVGRYLTTESILNGLKNTLILTALSMAIGIVGGIGLAVMRLSANPLMSWTAAGYIWLFRGTPVITQLLFWFYLGALFPRLGLGIPFGPTFVSVDTNSLIAPFTAALLGLGLNEAAYMAEIVRGGILSVEHGQTEAAEALGMTRARILRRIVLPQAMRVIIPPVGNEVIGMLKTTSLASAIGVSEILSQAQHIYFVNSRIMELLIVCAIWYLATVSVLSIGQFYLERHYAKGATSRALAPTPLQRLRAVLGTARSY